MMRRTILVALVFAAAHAGTALADDVSGFTTVGGYPAVVDVYLAPGASAPAAAAVLAAVHATTTPSNLFVTSG